MLERLTIWGIPANTLTYAGLLAGLAALRFIGLGDRSLGPNDLFSIYWAKAGPSFILGHAAQETNPPLFYLLLFGWAAIFGDSEAAIRLISAIFSAITIPVIYLLGRNLFNRTAGTLAAFLYALSYWHMVFANQARAYTLLNFFFTLMLLCLHRIILALKNGTPPIQAAVSLSGLAFVFLTAAAVYTHYVALCIFLTIGISLASTWGREFVFSRGFLICFILLGGCALLLIAPAITIALAERHSPNLPSPGEPSFDFLRNNLGTVLGVPRWHSYNDTSDEYIYHILPLVYKTLSVASGVVWAALLVYGAQFYRRRSEFGIVFVMPIVGFLVLVLASMFQPAFLSPRAALWLSIPVYLGVAGGVSVLTPPKLRRLVIVVLITFSAGFAVGFWITAQDDPWRAWVHDIASRVSRHDLVLLGSDTPAIAFLYYGERGILPLLRRWPNNVTAEDLLDAYVTGIRPINGDEITAARDRKKSILFVTRMCAVPEWIERREMFLPDGPCNVARPEQGGIK